MLIKDPYLASDAKNRSFSAFQPKTVGEFPPFERQHSSKANFISQKYKNITQPQKQDYSASQRIKIQSYERQMKRLAQAYKSQEQALRKMSTYQSVNQQYHQAMKQRNFQLNTKLNDLSYQKSLVARRHQEQILRNTYDKETILKKYQEQNQEIYRLKRSNTQLIQQKARLQSEIDHLMFLMEKDNHQGSLQIKQQLIRMENMQKTLRGIIDTKDQQITQLRHRLKVYQDQNRRLNDFNKTLTIVRQQKIDNLSKIDHLDSNIKSHNKENIDQNRRDDFLISQLNQQKQINHQLLSEINLMKKKLFQEPNNKLPGQKSNKQTIQYIKSSSGEIEKKLVRFVQLRNNINNKIYDLYLQSVKNGERSNKNSLLIFIQNYKKSSLKNLQSDIQQYTSLRQQLKSIHKSQPNSQIKAKIQLQLPMKLNSLKLSKDDQWVLSTIQFTKNQMKQDSSKNSKNKPDMQINNSILYIFRLLTIQYRVSDLNEKKQFNPSSHVNNEILHSIVKGLQKLIQTS